MIHPLVFGIALLDVLALGLLFAGALRAEPVVRGWTPGSASAEQLKLERGMEAASLFGRGGAVVLALSTVALVLAVASVLPTLVPGAMCGTGVIEATEGLGGRALTVRALTLLLLSGWFALDRLDRAAPRAPLAQIVALALLVCAPMAVWGVVDTARALWSLDTHGAVDCCAALYSEMAGAAAEGGAGYGPTALLAFGAGGALVIALGSWLGLRPRARGPAAYAFAALGLTWTPLAGWVLVTRLAAYHYEVLAHHCPWCLFLPEHGAVGYVLFGALGLLALESAAAAAARFAARAAPELERVAAARIQRAGRRSAVAVAIFLAVAVGPALSWYWRFGVWMHG